MIASAVGAPKGADSDSHHPLQKFDTNLRVWLNGRFPSPAPINVPERFPRRMEGEESEPTWVHVSASEVKWELSHHPLKYGLLAQLARAPDS